MLNQGRAGVAFGVAAELKFDAALTGSTSGEVASCCGTLRAKTLLATMFCVAIFCVPAFFENMFCAAGATGTLISLEISNANTRAQHIAIHRKVATHFHE
jgi:hypothetical protein